MHFPVDELAFVLHPVVCSGVDTVALPLALEEHARVGVPIGHGLNAVTMELVIQEGSFIRLSIDFAPQSALACDDSLDELAREDVSIRLGGCALAVWLAVHPAAVVSLAVWPGAAALTMRFVIFPLSNVTPAIWPLASALSMPLAFVPGAFVPLTRGLEQDPTPMWLIIQCFTRVNASI